MSGRHARYYTGALLLLLLKIAHVDCWRNWTSTRGPGARRGHTIAAWGTKVLLFGGRGDDTLRTHDPKTFEIQEIDGTWSFKSYETASVISCKDATDCKEKRSVPVATFYNDIWQYELACFRYSDEPCVDRQWTVVDPGQRLGGCKMYMGASICTHPAERYLHGASIYQNKMFVYGGYSKQCSDYCDDLWMFDLITNKWTELRTQGELSHGTYPGKRFRFSTVYDKENMYIFGGYRLWHGFSVYNSEKNNWTDTSVYPEGGYLRDLWVYSFANNTWEAVTATTECYLDPGLAWEDRFRTSCTTAWPSERAGHAAALVGRKLYVHGGYRTYFPYIQSNGAGSGEGLLVNLSAPAYQPFPTYPFFLDDLWEYDLDTGIWRELNPVSSTKPLPRQGHTMLTSDRNLLLFGGYQSNFYYGDFWQYNISTNSWSEQGQFPHPKYPPNCTDDLQQRRLEHSGLYAPFIDVQDPSNILLADSGNIFDPVQHYGTRKFSVFAEPTRGRPTDGVAGRASAPVFIPQARRQGPGWDGCRDRVDGRTDLPQTLQYEKPPQRAYHSAVYSKDYDLLLVYGGYGNNYETLPSRNITFQAYTLSDFWEFKLTQCLNNCSMKGDCRAGYCYCYDGYYGEDCSNSTCPGSFCYYDSMTKKQICNHCCQAGYTHRDNDTYVLGVQKLACSRENPGTSNGVCDGFGMCQCAPPFITADCSVKDCKNNCSGNGWCSVEYPVSRCMCNPGYIGDACQDRVCLNNCSYPNGQCVNGTCYCQMLYSPYNRTRQYYPYMGIDCSFIIPYAGSQMLGGLTALTVLLLASLTALLAPC